MPDRLDPTMVEYEGSDGSTVTIGMAIMEDENGDAKEEETKVDPTGSDSRTSQPGSECNRGKRWVHNTDLSKDVSALYGLFVLVTALCVIPLSEIVWDFDTEILRVLSRLFPLFFPTKIHFFSDDKIQMKINIFLQRINGRNFPTHFSN